MGGSDKTQLTVGRSTLLDRVIAAAASARLVVVVGPHRPTERADVVWVREEPPGSGPAAAVGAGLAATRAGVVVLLAGDMPLLDPGTVEALVLALRSAGTGVPGVVGVDVDGREQWLCSAWRRDQLLAAALEADGSLHRALRALGAPLRLELAGTTLDCDTPDDLAEARRRLDARVSR